MTSAHHGPGGPALYTAQEAADILRVKKGWLERQAAARKVPFTILGGSYRFTSAHLAAIIRMHEEAPVPDEHGGGARTRRAIAQPGAAGRSPAPLRPRPRSGPRRAA